MLIENFSGLQPGEEIFETIKLAQTLIASQPEKSVLAILDATRASFNSSVLPAMKDVGKANPPYIKRLRWLGWTGD